MDEGYGVECVIHLDYRTGFAFDTVPHRRLLTKLKMIVITGDLLEWIKAFLHNRMQINESVVNEMTVVNGEAPFCRAPVRTNMLNMPKYAFGCKAHIVSNNRTI